MTGPTKTSSVAEAPALLPCPFCGGANVKFDAEWVICFDCGAEGGRGVDAWNRRAALAQPPATEAEEVPLPRPAYSYPLHGHYGAPYGELYSATQMLAYRAAPQKGRTDAPEPAVPTTPEKTE